MTWSGELVVSGIHASVHEDMVPQWAMRYVGIPAMSLRYLAGVPVFGLTEDFAVRYYPRLIKFALSMSPCAVGALLVAGTVNARSKSGK